MVTALVVSRTALLRDASRWVLLAVIVLASPARADDAPADAESLSILRRHDIEPGAETVIAALRRWHPDSARHSEIATAIGQLASDNFETRESATRRLAGWGSAAIAPLRSVARSDDPEVASRATSLLREWETSSRRLDDDDLVVAAARWLSQSPTPDATPLLLELLPELPDACSQEAAGMAIWACARPTDAAAIRKLLEASSGGVRAALIPAIEIAHGDAAVEMLRPALKDANERIRLAAARALIDRRPGDSIATLIGLLSSPDAAVRDQSGWLLKQSSGIPAEGDANMDFAGLTRRWTAWAVGVAAHPPRPMGRRRLQPDRFGRLVSQSFSDAADQADIIRSGYRKFQYESTTNDAAVRVAGGVLRLEGDHVEGDQRLYVDSTRLFGLPQFPRRLVIDATIGGEATEAGTWHAGISAGNIRFLFHPGYNGGAFRAERVSDHFYLTENQTMPFTPEGGVLYNMTLAAARNDIGDVVFDVSVSSRADPAKRFSSTLLVAKADAGDMTRIGLERSGRTGGAALFGQVTVTQDYADPAAETR